MVITFVMKVYTPVKWVVQVCLEACVYLCLLKSVIEVLLRIHTYICNISWFTFLALMKNRISDI